MKHTRHHGNAGFTLIELMAVITIIVILAGLVVGGMGFVNERQAKEKAKVQMALLEKAIEEYKLDLGTYPPTQNKTTATAPNGTATSSILFDYLFWDSDRNSKGGTADLEQKVYLPELDPASSKQGWTTGTASSGLTIVDPWGNQYCYRTAFGPPKTGSDGKVTVSANVDTQNPDFDLWSMGKDGKSNLSTPSDKVNNDDIRNF